MRFQPLWAAALFALPLAVSAQDAAVARSLAATCANCHGTDGRGVGTGVAPLAGLPKALIVQRMKEFQSGARPATVMQQIAKGYSDAQIDMLAGYLAAQAAKQ